MISCVLKRSSRMPNGSVAPRSRDRTRPSSATHAPTVVTSWHGDPPGVRSTHATFLCQVLEGRLGDRACGMGRTDVPRRQEMQRLAGRPGVGVLSDRVKDGLAGENGRLLKPSLRQQPSQGFFHHVHVVGRPQLCSPADQPLHAQRRQEGRTIRTKQSDAARGVRQSSKRDPSMRAFVQSSKRDPSTRIRISLSPSFCLPPSLFFSSSRTWTASTETSRSSGEAVAGGGWLLGGVGGCSGSSARRRVPASSWSSTEPPRCKKTSRSSRKASKGDEVAAGRGVVGGTSSPAVCSERWRTVGACKQ